MIEPGHNWLCPDQGTKRQAILYDELVRSEPLIRYVLWHHTFAGAALWCNASDAAETVLGEFQVYPWVFDAPFTIGPREDFCPDGLELLIVLRSHPEMFGLEIRAARAAGAQLDIITIETIAGQAGG